MIHFSCSCGMKFRIKEEFAGQSTRCPTCKQPLVVPPPDKTVVHVPEGHIDGTASSLVQAGVDGGVTLGHEGAGPGQKSVGELLARQARKGQRYIIEKEIARGGMGAVLRAVDCDIRREVAVKYMLAETDAKKKLRFVEEAQITGQLEHPNIVPIHELGVDKDKRLFFAMKMVKGRSLAEVLDELRQNPRKATFSLSKLLNIFVSVCNGLAYAHSRAVVHRDLKPANIMIGDFGEVYVMDWGLAKVVNNKGQALVKTAAPPAALAAVASAPVPLAGPVLPVASGATAHASKVATSRAGDADLTQEGSVLGTPAYMPPEQAMGKIDAIDARSDIYSLGAILYEILTLQPPIDKEGGYLAILMRAMQGEIVVPEQRNRSRSIPRELSAIAMKALATNPQDRYQSVEAMRKDIERFQEGRSVSAKDDTKREMLWKFVKRNKGLSGGMAATFLVMVLSLWFIGQAWLHAKESLRKADENYASYQQEHGDKEDRTRRAVPALTAAARQVANSGKFKEALEQVDLTLLYDPSYHDASLLRAELLISKREWSAGQAELERYLRQRPKDADAKQLLELCASGKVNDSTVLFALAEVLVRHNLPGLAVPLLKDVELTTAARQPLLTAYQQQIDKNWQGLGERLRMEPNGQFNLNLDGCRQVTTLGALKGMRLELLNLHGCPITDLSPLQGMKLTSLNVGGSLVKDLMPLKGMPLTVLSVARCDQVRDLTPLKGMPLTNLDLLSCGLVEDLTPLKGMPLTTLNLGGCAIVRDLTPLKGMPLTWLDIGVCGLVSDLTPLKGMQLTYLDMKYCIHVPDLTALKGMPLNHLELGACHVSDLAPLKGMPLAFLDMISCLRVSDLTPLQGMSLQALAFTPRTITKGMEAIRTMPSLKKINGLLPEEFWKKYGDGEFSK